ncbi:AHL_G0011140.mRNA.1.CDS.1 [Saccharomyces cerevisiae]|nr:CPG_1a_G0011170.mRNA.1.CDS.1 [Saccharomyces cerevisiae]CAI4354996.1 AVB_G0010900.mRNA.1.CDS.1 [Saccharomyces cerevisiae]CAI4874284.1 AHL_G0011140.mRNA.1.CDS.1 [Saccharomyces cerevisiae]CAI6569359.1 AHL_G0011140.mRNA.1.CDS.1 [Saccharomyces cerevisiae]CAI7076011.1 AVB_G0010900.mRNA.1.CDS.1 [Saccharomyces cerevisiae]
MGGLVILDINNFAIVFLFHSGLENGPQHGQQGAATISRRDIVKKATQAVIVHRIRKQITSSST